MQAVLAYKSLAHFERAFRIIKTTRPEVQPLYVYAEEHVHGHVFLCLLACYLEWHLRQRAAPFLFHDETPLVRTSPVQKAQPSAAAKAKATSKQTPNGDLVNSMTTLLSDLDTLCLHEVTLPGLPEDRLTTTTQPTPLQKKMGIIDNLHHLQSARKILHSAGK